MPTLHWIGKEKVVNHHQEVPYLTIVVGQKTDLMPNSKRPARTASRAIQPPVPLRIYRDTCKLPWHNVT